MINRNFLFATSVVFFVSACNRPSKLTQLHQQVDSLKVELDNSSKFAKALQDVGSMIDSIDQNRHVLRTRMVEGTSVEDFKKSMSEINQYVKQTEKKIINLENRLSTANTSRSMYAASLKKVKEQLEMRTNELAALQEKVNQYQNENNNLIQTVNLQKAEIDDKLAQIETKKREAEQLEEQVSKLVAQAKIDQGDFYFTKGEILEEVAKRTKFAPRKKRNANKQALDMYELALVCGKEEAQAKVTELRKKI
jgi:chromosome segregation ATPase